MKRPRSLVLHLIFAAAVLAAPVRSQEPAQSCVEERAQLQEERVAISRSLGDIALGRGPKPKKRLKAGDVGQAVLGTAASVLLPFGLGTALSLGLFATRKSAREEEKAAPVAAEPDVSALIAREGQIDERLAAIDADGCAP